MPTNHEILLQMRKEEEEKLKKDGMKFYDFPPKEVIDKIKSLSAPVWKKHRLYNNLIGVRWVPLHPSESIDPKWFLENIKENESLYVVYWDVTDPNDDEHIQAGQVLSKHLTISNPDWMVFLENQSQAIKDTYIYSPVRKHVGFYIVTFK